jgi:L-histidine Nalpha-methyltransferase / hercynylcysteine S-oxide synthase
LRKTLHLLSALSKIVPERTTPAPITYYALDLERRELERSLDQLAASPVGPEMRGKVDTRGLWGTFEGGLGFAAEGGFRGREAIGEAAAALRSRSLSSDAATTQPSLLSSEQDSVETAPSTPDVATVDTPLHVLFLGSSLGMFRRGEDAAFLNALPLRVGKGDTLLIGIDHCTDGARIERAYNDRAGITRRFILNGLKVAGRALGDESLFLPEKWEYVCRYNAEERASLPLELFSGMTMIWMIRHWL